MMLATTHQQDAPIRIEPGSRYCLQDCDECRILARCYRSGRDRQMRDRIKPELLCEACAARLSTDPDPFGVMEKQEGVGGTLGRLER